MNKVSTEKILLILLNIIMGIAVIFAQQFASHVARTLEIHGQEINQLKIDCAVIEKSLR